MSLSLRQKLLTPKFVYLCVFEEIVETCIFFKIFVFGHTFSVTFSEIIVWQKGKVKADNRVRESPDQKVFSWATHPTFGYTGKLSDHSNALISFLLLAYDPNM